MIINKDLKILIQPLTHDEYQQLEENIVRDGCRDPLVLWGDTLIDGHNRLEICTRLGIDYQTVSVDFDSLQHVKLWMIKNQLGRRNLVDFAKIILMQLQKELLAEIGKKTQGTRTDILSTIDKKLEPHNTQKTIAEDLGWSTGKVAMADKVIKNSAPEVKQALMEDKISINSAYQIVDLPKEKQVEIIARGEKEILKAAKEIRNERAIKKRDERIVKIAEISKGNGKELTGNYPVIYCDPPWRYEYIETESRAIENHYPTMSLDEIKGLKIPSHDDCVLFMWATSPKLHDAMSVLDAWGFNYKTCAVWDKKKIGMGYYFRQQHELLLVATKGNPPTPLPENRPSSVFSFMRGNHSSKPHEVYEIIEKMYSGLPMLEMFCRTPRDGWSVWGNQS